MKFSIRKEELEMAVKVIKDSKALGKANDDQGLSCVLIEADEEFQSLKITSSNLQVWCIIELNQKSFEDYNADFEKFFKINETGSVFIEGHELISVISGYPQSSLISFSNEQKEKDGHVTKYLQAIAEVKKGKVIKNSFAIKEPMMFEKEPQKEETKNFKINSKKVHDAVNSVEFVSGTDEKNPWLWGVQIEVYNDEVAAMATDKKRICYYDTRGEDRKEINDAIIFTPVKTPLISAMKNLNMSELIEVEVGEKKTIIKQGFQKHVIPNVVFSSNKLPDWRAFAKKLNSEERVEIKFPKKTIIDCVKRAVASTGCYYGIQIKINTEEKEVEFSIQKVEDSGIIQSKYSETEPLEEGQYSGQLSETIVMTIDSLRDIVQKSKSDILTMRVKDSSSPVQIINASDNFGYIAATAK